MLRELQRPREATAALTQALRTVPCLWAAWTELANLNTDYEAMAGEGGELEHTALWHVPGGYAMRERLGEAKAIVPSSMKVGGPGTRVDVPLGHINAAYVRSHFDAMEVGIPDAPRAGELMFALAMSRGPRIHNRMGGLASGDVKGEDGLR